MQNITVVETAKVRFYLFHISFITSVVCCKESRTVIRIQTRGLSNLTKSASRGANSPVRGHPRGSKVVSLNSWGRVSY